MRTKVLLGLAVAVMLILSVATIGSNMGFKISIPLYAFASGTHSGFNWVSLPYYVGYTSAVAAFSDIPNCVEIQQWTESTKSYKIYDGDSFPDDWPIAPAGSLQDAGALLVKVSANGNWIVVGSHNPSQQVPLYAYSAGTHSGFNWRSIPYHTTAPDVVTLFSQIPSCVEIQVWKETTKSYLIYDGDSFPDNFALTPGQPVLVKVSSNQNWTPAHY
jgi:hypothetical protein